MKSFNYNKYCPEPDILKKYGYGLAEWSEDRQFTSHNWHTDDEKMHWESLSFSFGDGIPRYKGSIRAICLNCGSKIRVCIAPGLSFEEKKNFDEDYTKDKFNVGEYKFEYVFIENKIVDGKYSPNDYVSHYCVKSAEFNKKHIWRTDSDRLLWYGEPCGETPMASGYCILCGAKSNTLALDYPCRGEEIQKWEKNFSKESFNNGEYSVDCWSYTQD